MKMVTEQEFKEVTRALDNCIDTLRSWLKASVMQLGQVSRYKRIHRQMRLAGISSSRRWAHKKTGLRQSAVLFFDG